MPDPFALENARSALRSTEYMKKGYINMLPAFLGIGAQKSGSTWLDANLRRHPAIWMAPMKEIHYFDRPSKPEVLNFLHYKRSVRRPAFGKAKSALSTAAADPSTIGWYLRYYSSRRSDSWYESLFLPDAGQVAGDITPAYARLAQDDVARVAALVPDAKIIYLIRNPILRMWAQVSHYFQKYRHAKASEIDEKLVMHVLENEKSLRNSRYLTNLQNWRAFFPPEQIFVGFFEQISDSPSQLLNDVYEFLEVDASALPHNEKMHKKIGGRNYARLPAKYAQHLARALHEEIHGLHNEMANEYTASWLAFAKEHLDRSKAY